MLACHDLRTPLATVHGFAQTLARTEGHDETTARYLEMINAAATQLAELIDELSLARADRGRPLRPGAAGGRHARARAGRRRTARRRARAPSRATGRRSRSTPRPPSGRSPRSRSARCATAAWSEVELAVRGAELALSPITPASAPVVLGEDLRDLGAAVAVRVVQRARRGVAVDDETLRHPPRVSEASSTSTITRGRARAPRARGVRLLRGRRGRRAHAARERRGLRALGAAAARARGRRQRHDDGDGARERGGAARARGADRVPAAGRPEGELATARGRGERRDGDDSLDALERHAGRAGRGRAGRAAVVPALLVARPRLHAGARRGRGRGRLHRARC